MQQVANCTTLMDRTTQIALQDVNEPVRVLHRNRAVQAQFVSKLIHFFIGHLTDFVNGNEQQNWIAPAEKQQQKNEEGDNNERWRHQEDASEQVAKHVFAPGKRKG